MSYIIPKGWTLHHNPQILAGFGPWVRGVITPVGDLYLENFSQGTIHNDILSFLFDEGVLSVRFRKNWTTKTPDETGFLTVQRYRDTGVICIGESNRLLYTKAGYDAHIHLYQSFLNAAKIKNPGIIFVDQLVRIKAPFKGDREYVVYSENL